MNTPRTLAIAALVASAGVLAHGIAAVIRATRPAEPAQYQLRYTREYSNIEAITFDPAVGEVCFHFQRDTTKAAVPPDCATHGSGERSSNPFATPRRAR